MGGSWLLHNLRLGLGCWDCSLLGPALDHKSSLYPLSLVYSAEGTSVRAVQKLRLRGLLLPCRHKKSRYCSRYTESGVNPERWVSHISVDKVLRSGEDFGSLDAARTEALEALR